MAMIASLMAIVILSTGLVAGPAQAAGDPIAQLRDTAADGSVFAGDAPPLGPLALMILFNNLYTCYELFARQTGPDVYSLRGQTRFFNNAVAIQAVIGLAFLSGGNINWGLEAFPTPLLPVAAKIGGLLALATLTGNGYGFHFLAAQFIAFQFITRLLNGPCPSQFQPAENS